ncbi:D-glycerate dehydrogenase [Apibacter sp. HY039]|uniref:2-hydroxyacid dehydrogenase n=1 Tax=Apibacter sp. HY039 TaxID=2501476 RepID=UPI000FEB9646|nr:D-glycerate dehydrogenase [Apibacter sp. HY039]
MKIFISGMIPESGIEMLKKEGCEVEVWSGKQLSEKELIDKCKDADGYINVMTPVTANFLKQSSHLKVISTFSVGFNHIDLSTATQLGIPVGNTPDVLSNATADVAFLLMLNVSRKAFYNYSKIRTGNWNQGFDAVSHLGQELNGKTLGIFGMGRIGIKMAEKCKGAYGMNIIYHNRNRHEQAEKELGAVYVSFDELLKQSDILSLHAPLSDDNKGLFNKHVFEKMKPNAILVNTARGAMVNEEDLVEALKNQQIWGAGLDVTDPEPIPKDHPLLTMESVAITPHIGSATVEARNAMSDLCAKNILAGLKGEKLPCVVNPEVYK